jgi:peptide/nickel transport system substrate-binding protein
MKTTLWSISVLALALLLAACGGGKEIEKAKTEEVLTLLRGDESAILDPHATNSGGDANLIQQMYEGLVRPSEKPPVVWEPCLAESFSADAEFKVYTFKLRKGVKFHDGADLNAAAVKRSFERCRNKNDASAPPDLPYADEYFGDIVAVETPDDMTVVFKLKDVNPKFVANTGLFSSSIVSPTAIEALSKIAEAKEREAWLTRHPAGTGPYTIAEPGDYKDASTITMTAFAGYWGGAPAIKRVVFKQAKEAKQRREQIISGAVQVIDSPAPDDWKDLRAAEGVELYSWKAENLCYLALNCDPAKGFITADVNVRKAIAMAIDRDPLIGLYAGTAVDHHVLLPPVTLGFPEGYVPSTDKGSMDERLAKAKNLLKEAGIEGSPKLKLLLPAVARPYLGKPPEIADLLRQQLAKIGIELELERQPMAELGVSMREGKAPLVLIGWMGETGEPDDFWRPLLSGTNGPSNNNATRFFNATVADKIDVALKERDLNKRRQMYEALEKSVHEEFRPMVPLLSAMQAVAWSKKVEGLYVDSTGTYRLHKARYTGN